MGVGGGGGREGGRGGRVTWSGTFIMNHLIMFHLTVSNLIVSLKTRHCTPSHYALNCVIVSHCVFFGLKVVFV